MASAWIVRVSCVLVSALTMSSCRTRDSPLGRFVSHSTHMPPTCTSRQHTAAAIDHVCAHMLWVRQSGIRALHMIYLHKVRNACHWDYTTVAPGLHPVSVDFIQACT